MSENGADEEAQDVDANEIAAFLGGIALSEGFDLFDDNTVHAWMEKENEFCKLIGGREMGTAMSLWHNYGMHEEARTLLAKLTEMLDENSELANCASDYDFRYMSALERAVERCQIPVVELLFSKGADPMNNKYEGELPTMASVHGDQEMQYLPNWTPADPERASGRTMPGFLGLLALCDITLDPPYEGIRMIAWLRSRQAKDRFKKVRNAVRTRAIVIFWLGKAMETACADGGTGRLADRDAFVADTQQELMG